MAVLERSATMGVIAAAPTAGSSGVVPGAVLAVSEALGLDDDALAEALYCAAAVGLILSSTACVAGAEGGCQAEVGSAAAMAAAALVQMHGGTPAQALECGLHHAGEPVGPRVRPGGRPGGSALPEPQRHRRGRRVLLRPARPFRHRAPRALRRDGRDHVRRSVAACPPRCARRLWAASRRHRVPEPPAPHAGPVHSPHATRAPRRRLALHKRAAPCTMRPPARPSDGCEPEAVRADGYNAASTHILDPPDPLASKKATAP